MTITEFLGDTSNDGEEWRSIPGYEATYMVSSHGRVLSVPRPRTSGGIRKAKVAKRGGYLSVALVQNGKQTTHEVHRLVALAFLGPRPDGNQVRHLDGNPLNPRLENLAYGTRTENAEDKILHGRDHNVNKTHCPRGHAYAGENILKIPSRPTARYCRTCNVKQKRESQRRRTERRRAEQHPDYLQEWAL